VDAILVSAGTYPLTNGELSITQDLTISRVGAGSATISGSNSSRIFDVSGSGTDFDLKFLTLTQGSVSGTGPSYGGAILGGPGTTITVESSTISNSSVSADADAEGGAIYSNGNVTIKTASGSITGSSISGSSATITQSSGINARGGGVAVSGGTLTVGARTSITGNSATDASNTNVAEGGGVYVDAGATFTQATVSGNTAAGGEAVGGGVVVDGGLGTFVRSTINGNTANGPGAGAAGGGIAAGTTGSATLDLQLSTVSGNTATASGGPTATGGGLASLAAANSMTMTNSTIASNSATGTSGSPASGPGLAGGTSAVTLAGTILAGNGDPTGEQCDSAGVTSTGYDVLGPLGTCSYSAGTGDVTGVTDPSLKSLADNGGLTHTMLFTSASPALDVIPAADTLCTNQSTDQRGVSRPQQGNCDAGAVEMRPATLSISTDSYDLGLAPLSTPATGSVTVSNTGELDTAAPTPSVAAPFAASGCTSAIDGGSSCMLDLQFAPTAGGRFADVLQLTSGSLSDTTTLHGIGWAPTVAPQIPGTPSVGVETSVSAGRWPAPVSSFTIKWRRCDADGISNCGDISGATRPGYKPVVADVGHTLRVVITAHSSTAVDSDPVTTAASQVVTQAPPTLLQSPVITDSASPVVGTILYASRGKWTGAPDSYSFQWVRCDADGTSNCVDMGDPRRGRYTPVAQDVGHTLRVRVVATNSAGSSAPATSAPTGVVSS